MAGRPAAAPCLAALATLAVLIFGASPLAAQDRLVYRETTSGRIENFIVDIAGAPTAPGTPVTEGLLIGD